MIENYLMHILKSNTLVLRILATGLVGVGVALRGTLFLIESFGPERLILSVIVAIAVLVGIPLLIFLVTNWHRMTNRKAKAFVTGVVLGIALIVFVAVSVPDFSHSTGDDFPTGLSDFLTHPGDIVFLGGAQRFQVNGSISTRFNFVSGTKISIRSYGGAVAVKFEDEGGIQFCQSVVGTFKDCYLPRAGTLVLESKTAAMAYIKITQAPLEGTP